MIQFGEHVRPGRCWPRLAASRLRVKLTRRLKTFVAPEFSARARKTAPEAGALPLLFRSSRFVVGCSFFLFALPVDQSQIKILHGLLALPDAIHREAG